MGPGQGAVMRSELGLAGRCGFALLAITVIGLPIALFAHGISVAVFTCVASVWLLVSVMLVLGESVTEVKIWQTSIKRDVQAARIARDEAEAIRDQLKQVAELNIENVYLLNSLVAGVCIGLNPGNGVPLACGHISGNLDRMTPIISTDDNVVRAWQERMRMIIRSPGDSDPY
jgi:hypothetical protein